MLPWKQGSVSTQNADRCAFSGCAASAGIFGALYCLADVHTEFSEVAKQLKEVAELLGQGLNRQLSGPLLHEYLVRATGGRKGGKVSASFHYAARNAQPVGAGDTPEQPQQQASRSLVMC